MKKVSVVLMIGLATAMYACGPSRVVVSSRPERPYYNRPNAPGAGYTWVGGDWQVRGGRYVYREGYWTKGRRVWVGGDWRRTNRGWYWQPGHWR